MNVGPSTEHRNRVAELRAIAAAHPDGLVDCNLGTPCDPVPAFVADAVRDAVAASGPYPLSAGSAAYRAAAAAWVTGRFGVEVEAAHVGACVGTKEFVASFVHHLRLLRGADRDTVLYPEIAYPTYAVGAQFAGCRAVPVRLDDDWLVDLESIDPEDARRAAVLWLNVPGNPTGATAGRAHLEQVAEWGRRHGVVVVSDECYVEYAPDAHSIVEAGLGGVLALHSLSKRSNFAGMRTGFYVGDPELVASLIDVRREAGLIVPTPVQAAAVVALSDDEHVRTQRSIYERRKAFTVERLAAHGIRHVGGSMPFYLWLRTDAVDNNSGGDGFDLARRFAGAGWLIAPGATFGPAGNPFARIALVQPDDVLHTALDRFDALDPQGDR